jgi:hypothetical protein
MMNRLGDGLRMVIQKRLNKYVKRVEEGLPLDESEPDSPLYNYED